MGWSNGPKTWSELNARLSDRPRPDSGMLASSTALPDCKHPGDPSPPVSSPLRDEETTPYAELHCHTNFSFLDGASHAEELVEEAVRLGLTGLAITDHDGLYGVVRFAEAARLHGLPTVFGAEITLEATSAASARVGLPDPEGDHLVVLATNPIGYGRLARALSSSHLAAGEKSAPTLLLEQLAALGEGSTVPFHEALRRGPAPESLVRGDTVLASLQVTHLHESMADTAALNAAIARHPANAEPAVGSDPGVHWKVLTGCRKGAVPRALVHDGPRAAARALDRLIDTFGRDRVVVELWDHGDPLDAIRNDGMARLAAHAGVDLVATNNVHYAHPSRRPLATALAAVRARRSLDEVDGWLPGAAGSHLRSGAEQARRFSRYPGAVQRAAELAAECSFDLKLVAPNLPPYPCPNGMTEMGFIRELTERGAEKRYGRRLGGPNGRDGERVPGAYAQIDHELDLIEHLGFAGYFLVVWDLVEFCRRSNIFCQGRGSAANSAVCYSLGITNADAVSLGLLFERFLSPERDGPPDIDIDIESDRREEVIQYVYARYGRENAAQVANVITYRSRSAVRDMGRALGHAPGQLDAWSKQVDGWSRIASTAQDPTTTIPGPVLKLAALVEDFPRHLGIHSGGMVICDRPVVEVCPVEWGRLAIGGLDQPENNENRENSEIRENNEIRENSEIRENRENSENEKRGDGVLSRRNRTGSGGTPLRTVLQWDKEDCAAAGLVKFDLLGLGMLSALHYGVDFIRDVHGTPVDLALIEQEDDVYDMICAADTVGVFQIESRAQMATLPRLKPRTFYDLVVEVALIRPGPIQGGSVHPYIRRRNGEEPITYLHPLLEKSLKKTLGIPLFQEQLMQMSIDIANFTPSEADQLRQAMGSKRSTERMERLKRRLYEGMYANGVDEPTADIIYDKLAAFANYGFPESHSVSFAYIVYSSCWMKHHYPAAFCAALLKAQPMGFYSPQSLTADARRHGVQILAPSINASDVAATCEWASDSERTSSDKWAEKDERGYPVHQPGVRLGLADVRNVGNALAERIVNERLANGPFENLSDFARRTDPGEQAMEAIATADGFACFGLERRKALWAAGALAHATSNRLAGIITGEHAPALPGMGPVEEMAADLWATGVTPDGYPTQLTRDRLQEMGVRTSADLRTVEHGTRVWVGGVVTHRQRPQTAGGTTFINLEDETGLVNVIVSKGVWTRYKATARGAGALLVRGILERTESRPSPRDQACGNPVVINVIADRIDLLRLDVRPGQSRDFR
jgi:error-prone DNA polymerase